MTQIQYGGPRTPAPAPKRKWKTGCVFAAVTCACFGVLVASMLVYADKQWRDGKFTNASENQAEAQRRFGLFRIICQVVDKAMIPDRDPSYFYHVKGSWQKREDLCSLLSRGQQAGAVEFHVQHDLAEARLPKGRVPTWWKPALLGNPRGCFIDNGMTWVWVIMGDKQGEAYIAEECH